MKEREDPLLGDDGSAALASSRETTSCTMHHHLPPAFSPVGSLSAHSPG